MVLVFFLIGLSFRGWLVVGGLFVLLGLGDSGVYVFGRRRGRCWVISVCEFVVRL